MHPPRLFIIIVVITFSLIMVGGVLAAASLSASVPKSENLDWSTMIQWPEPPDGEGPWVVRAYYNDRELVSHLVSELEPWEVHHDKGYLVVAVDREQFQWLLNLGFRIEIDQDLTTNLNQPNLPLPEQVTGIPGYACYRTVEETFTTAQNLASMYPHLASWIDVGDSWEKEIVGGDPGYDLFVLRLTNSQITVPKPKLFVMSSVHAREYAPAELNTRFAEYLVNNYDLDPDVTWLLDYHEIHLMLQANPDGRKRAETGLSWRKNTDNNFCSNTNSRGVDLNRNFMFQWGCCGGSSGSECSETFRGPSPASEPETQAIQAYVRSKFPDQRADPLTEPAPPDATGIFLDIHSYSELVLWPWGFTSAHAPNNTALQTLGRKFAYFNNYHPEQAIGLYPTDGTTDDFAYGELGLAAYTFELGTSFFQDCGSFENTILPDNLEALLYSAKVVRTPYLTPAGPEVLNLTVTPVAISAGELVDLNATADDTRFSSANGVEPSQHIVEAEYYLDTPPWITTTIPVAYAMSASDGSFDASIESLTASIDTNSLSQGRHTVFARGRDASGYWGPVSAAFIFVLDPTVAPTLQGYVREAGTNVPLEASIQAGAFQTSSDPTTGFYSMLVISGTYDVSAVAPAHIISTSTGVATRDYQITEQDFQLYPTCNVLDDDVEAGSNGWSTQGNWSITTEDSHSPTHSWTDSPGGVYPNNQNISLTSANLDLSDYNGTTLSFWHKYDLEVGYDYTYVEYSTDGGLNWNQAARYNGLESNWTQIEIPMSALDGSSNARVRFRLYTDSSVQRNGWHIDDILISGGGPTCISDYVPVAQFASNSPVVDTHPVRFTNLSTGTPPMTYTWDFGDELGNSIESDPSYTYPYPGTFTVTLTVSNTLGDDSIQHPVIVLPCTPLSGIELTQITPGPLYKSTPVIFNADLSPNDAYKPYHYSISYGDGEHLGDTQSTADPLEFSHTYSITGTYTLEFAAWNCNMTAPVTNTIQIEIVDYHIGEFSPSDSTLSGDPGKPVTHTIQLTNLGDTIDTFSLTLGGGFWASELTTSMVTLASNESTGIDVSISIPPTAVAGESDQVILQATSSYPDALSVTATLTTTANAVYGVIASSPASELNGYPGQTISYTLVITNTGNATDTLDLLSSGNSWPISIPPEVTLTSDESTTVIVTVTIPSYAGGQTDNTLIQVTSRNDPTQQALISFTTTADYSLWMPLMTAWSIVR